MQGDWRREGKGEGMWERSGGGEGKACGGEVCFVSDGTLHDSS